MFHRELAGRYRRLAAAFAEEGLAAETLGCLAAAIELDRSSGEDEVRRLLRWLADLDVVGRPDRSPKVSRLMRHRQKLDAQVARARKVAESLEAADPAPPLSASEASIPPEMLRRLARLEVRLSGIDGRRYERAHRRLKRFLDRRGPAGRLTLEMPAAAAGTEKALYLNFAETQPVECELRDLADEFYRLDRYDEAILCYDLALELNQDLLEAWFNRGLAHTRKRDYGPAEKDLSQVIELDGSLGEAWFTRGLIRQHKEEYDEAIADFEEALARGYDKAESQLLVARQKRDESRTRRRGKGDDSDDSEGRIRDFSPYLTKPDCTLSDVGGHREAKRRLRTIAAYLQGDEILDEWGAELPRGVLLCGRPGVGKTHLARCLAGEAKCPFYAPPTSVFEDMWAGNMQKNLRRLWQQASEHSKAVVFLDEFDSLGSRRAGARDPDAWYNRMVGCILELMDNLARRSERVVVIAATNRKENIDAAFLRPGRFTYVVKVDSPTAFELAEIWLIHLEAAACRARRIDCFTDGITEAMLVDRSEWLERALRGRQADPAWIIRLAQLSEQKDLVGDDVREIIRRTIDERVMAALDCGLDLGPIGPDDLYRQLEDYESGLRADEQFQEE